MAQRNSHTCAATNIAEGYHPALFTEVAQNYVVPHRPGAIDTNVAKYLVGEWTNPSISVFNRLI